MLKIKLSLLSLISFVAGGVFAQTNSFVYSPTNPLPGKQVQIIYDTKGTPLAPYKNVRAVVHAYSNYRWRTTDLSMTPAGNGKFTATLPLDPQFGLAALKFIAGDTSDNNHDQAYVIMATDPEHKNVNAPAAYAGWGMLRASNFGYGVPGYFAKTPKLTDTAFYYWLNNEILWHSKQAGEALAIPFARAVLAYQGDAGKPRVNNIFSYLTQKNDEVNLLRARTIAKSVTFEKMRVDSLDTVMIRRFPKGEIAKLNAFKLFNTERDLDKKRLMGEALLTNFPRDGAFDEFDQDNRFSYPGLYQTLIILGAMKKDWSPLDKYLNELDYSSLINLYYKLIEIPHNRKDQTDAALLPYANKLLARLELAKNTVPAEYWYLSPLQWKDEAERYIAKGVLPVQVSILRNTGNTAQALIYATRAQNFYQYKKASLNDDQAYLLNKTKQYARLRALLEKAVYQNQSSPEMLALLKADYQRRGKPVAQYEAYVTSLKNPDLAVRNSEDIRKAMINKEMPDWSMTDLNGKAVKFADLHGKTIVMDFWATWCVPCKASFPGMKLAVDHYKADPNVVFYFVDTEERGDKYKQEVAKYIKDNHYPFNILFDNHAKGASVNDEVFARICKAFTISGIPMKLIIDPKGKLRFLTDGYKGSPTALSDEIIEMVELTRKSE
jgi:thiol-disulfide isomerase/thioredoxin